MNDERLQRVCGLFTRREAAEGYLGLLLLTLPSRTMTRSQTIERSFFALMSTLLLAFILFAGVFSATAQSAESLFQKALRMERTNGDYAAAVESFRVVFEHPGADRALEANSLLRMGLAYENLGRTEAMKVFETLLLDYADIEEVVSAARDGISRTSSIQASSTPASNKNIVIDGGIPMSTWGASVSPSGNHVVAIDNNTGHPGWWSVSDQTWTSFTRDDHPSGWGQYVRLSPDEQTFAYGFYNADNPANSVLVLMDRSTRALKTIHDPMESIFLRFMMLGGFTESIYQMVLIL